MSQPDLLETLQEILAKASHDSGAAVQALRTAVAREMQRRLESAVFGDPPTNGEHKSSDGGDGR